MDRLFRYLFVQYAITNEKDYVYELYDKKNSSLFRGIIGLLYIFLPVISLKQFHAERFLLFSKVKTNYESNTKKFFNSNIYW